MVGWGGSAPPRPPRRAFRTEFRRLQNTPNVFISYYMRFGDISRLFKIFEKIRHFHLSIPYLTHPPYWRITPAWWAGGAPPPRPPRRAFRIEFRRLRNTHTVFTTYHIRFGGIWGRFENFENFHDFRTPAAPGFSNFCSRGSVFGLGFRHAFQLPEAVSRDQTERRNGGI